MGYVSFQQGTYSWFFIFGPTFVHNNCNVFTADKPEMESSPPFGKESTVIFQDINGFFTVPVGQLLVFRGVLGCPRKLVKG